MPKGGFNLTANLVFQGPTNLNAVIQRANKQIQAGLKGSVNLKFNANTNAQLRTLSSRLSTINTQLQSIQANANAAATAMSNMATSINTAARNSSRATAGLNNTATAARSVANAAAHGATQMEEFGRVAGLAIRRFAGFSIATGVIFGIVRSLQDGVAEALQFQKSIVQISQVTRTGVAGLQSLTAEITRLSTSLGVSSSELLSVSRILSQAGLTATDTRIALDALAKTTLAPTFGDITNTVEGSIAAMAQFKLQAKDLEKVLGSINVVSAAFAVESEDIVSAIRKTGGVFAAASGDIAKFDSAFKLDRLNEFVALFTSVRATTRESAETIATGLRTIFTRLQRVSTITSLENLGIELSDAEGKFVGVFEAIKRLSEGLRSLDTRDIRFNQIIEELGGFRQIGKAIPLITRFSDAQKALQVAQRGSNSLSEDATKAQEAFLVQIAKVREEFLALIRDFTDTTSFKAILNLILQTTRGLIGLASAVKPVLPLITAIAAIKGASVLTQFTRGFFGGLRSNLAGNVATGGATGTSAAAVAGRGGNVLANTTAVTANTTALTALTAALRVFGLARFPGIRFARGGVVPGTGNSDSVPATLMPGEFVMRKRAVKKLGTDKLQAMNDGRVPYAVGDLVRRDLTAKSAGFASRIGQKNLALNAAKTRKIREGTDESLDTFGAIFLRPAGQARNFIATDKGGRFNLRTASMDKGVSERLEQGFASSAISSIKQGAKLITDEFKLGTPGTFPEANLLKQIGFDNALGRLFEGALTVAGGGPFRDNDPSSTFDFIGGLPTSLKGKFPSLSGVGLIDAKSSFSNRSVQTVFAKVKAFRKQQRELAKLQAKNAQFEGKDIAGRIGQLGNKDLDALRRVQAGKRKPISDILKRIGVTRPEFDAFHPFHKFAKGGAVGDSVPAVLTPGEFVLNREAVSRIGVGNLRRMNDVQGFNDGGPVGMAFGGTAPHLPSLNRAGQSFQAAFPRHLNIFDEAIREFQAVGLQGRQLSLAVKRWVQLTKQTNDAVASFAQTTKEMNGVQRRNMLRGAKKFAKERLAGVGTAGILLGAPLAQEAIGTGTPLRAGAGAALTGAAVGGVTGSFLGPWGAAIGAVVGGLASFENGLREAEEALAMNKLKTSIESLTGTIDKFEARRATLSEARGQVGIAFGAATESFNTKNTQSIADRVTTGIQRFFTSGLFVQFDKNARNKEESAQRAKEAAVFEGEFGPVFDEARRLTLAQIKAGKLKTEDDAVNFFENISGVREAKLNAVRVGAGQKVFDRIDAVRADANEFALLSKLEDATKRSTKAFDDLVQRIVVAEEAFKNAADVISLSSTKFGNVLALNDPTALGKVAIQNPTKNLTSRSVEDVRGGINGLLRAAGIGSDTQTFKDISGTVTGSKILSTTLKEALKSTIEESRAAAGAGTIFEDSEVNTVIGKLSDKEGFKDIPERMREAILENLRGILLNRKAELGSGELNNLIESPELREIVDKIGKQGEQAANELFNTINELNQAYEQMTASVVQQQLKVDEEFSKGAQLAAKAALTLQEAAGGPRLTIGQRASTDDLLIGRLSARSGAASSRPADLLAQQRFLVSQIDAATQTRQAASIGGAGSLTDTQKALLKSDVENRAKLAANTAALNAQVNATERLSAIQEEMAIFEKRKAAASGLLEGLATQSPEDRLQGNINRRNAIGFLGGQNLQGPQLQGALDELRRIGETLDPDKQAKLEERINRRINEIVNSAGANTGGIRPGNETLEGLATTPKGGTATEQDFRRQLADALNHQIAAQQALAEIEKDRLVPAITALTTVLENAQGALDIVSPPAKSIEGFKSRIFDSIERFGTPTGKFNGGYIGGPFRKRDGINTNLNKGEFVVNRHSTGQNRELLEAINSGEVQGFARGGRVRMTREQYKNRKRELRNKYIDSRNAKIEAYQNRVASYNISRGRTINPISVAAKRERNARLAVQAFKGDNLLSKPTSILSAGESMLIKHIKLGRIKDDIARNKATREANLDRIRGRINKSAVSPASSVSVEQASEPVQTQAFRGAFKPSPSIPGLTRQPLSLGPVGSTTHFNRPGMTLQNVAPDINGNDSISQAIRSSRRQDELRRYGFGGIKGFADGGSVGPTDTIPAMLTKGEFVVKKDAAARNIALLKAINSGGVKGFANGGSVSGGASVDGGVITALQGFSAATSAMIPSLDSFTSAISTLNSTLQQLQNIVIPESISVEVAPVRVIVSINGAEALANMEQPIGDMVSKQVREALNRHMNTITGETSERLA